MRLKTLIVIALLGLMLIAVLSFAQAEPPSGTPGNILDKIAGLQTQITELLGNAAEQELAIQAESDARLSGDQTLWENATEQQEAIDAIVSICPGTCAEGGFVIGIDQAGKIICSCPSTAPNYCPGIGCVNFSDNPQHCGECDNSCSPGYQCCYGECVDLSNDRYNCGSCGHQCPFKEDYCCDGECCSGSG